ncbi:MAG: hypothetical protein A3D47_02310 [Candidatus Colwellbacteria bacterium RIFCSPHIGHO2_02_FULL_43_15]|uniref:Putative gluconeogenesis factor n=2 Tax=Candidatus Colwelliibacteriota TaxID=1817904 RepID=A0A1G1Z0S7_9BACT|nr:MAG: hypothetical protein A3D47_02310 [Candidatus Colwellbacteria bacterium RIFCSPHIGHO2_02_FULL_43_15]OGY60940.1 MAG: hypothetical protein A3F99_01775 [Candidatus Colwellbacteria bacterium RIFCSPLOWO2_12_FULL_43_11]
MKRVVVIGGGTGVFTVLSGLKKYSPHLTAVVTMADEGGSTGFLREEFGILPPGDVRRALIALADADNELLSELFNYRFKEGAGLTGHSFGNLMLTALERITGSFGKAVKEAEKILGVKGRVIPSTLDKSRLFAQLEGGLVLKGEGNIDIPSRDRKLKIEKVWLKPKAVLNPEARDAILKADGIVIGPGDLYTSLMPNLLVSGMPEAIKASKARKIYVVNFMTKFGETNNFVAGDFVNEVEKYLGRDVLDFALINSTQPSPQRMRKYILEKASLVEIDKLPHRPSPIFGDFLRSGGFIRHDPDKLARVIVSLI